MKKQFKWAFLAGVQSARGIVFAIVAGMMAIFMLLGTIFELPEPALITAVSLGGIGIAVMLVFNIINDVAIAGRMFSAPGAYLHSLVPVHRAKTLFASVTTMMVLDISTMAIVIWGETWLSLMLAGENNGLRTLADNNISQNGIVWGAMMLISGYLLVMMMIMFCSAVRDSVLYQKRASGLIMTALVCVLIYAISLLPLILAPFSAVTRDGMFIQVTLSGWTMYAYPLLHLAAAAGLFIPTSKLMEKKLNV